jgi:hypothetical protein
VIGGFIIESSTSDRTLKPPNLGGMIEVRRGAIDLIMRVYLWGNAQHREDIDWTTLSAVAKYGRQTFGDRVRSIKP